MGGNSTKTTKNAGNTKSSQNTKNMQNAKSKGAYNRKTTRKNLWISIALYVSLALNVTLIIVLAVGNKGTSDTNVPSSNYSDADTSGMDVFQYSKGIDENGFWEDIVAREYVDFLDYRSFSIPREAYEVTADEVQSEVFSLVGSYYPETKQITDRAVIDGDTVSIDYVGSVNGVEFSGGNSEGSGPEVVAGSTDYIDDFLTQIIGHMPGETINIEVTFPDVYESEPDLAGKDAVFVTTINHIVEYTTDADYDIGDGFVEEYMYADYGWRTVNEMESAIRDRLQSIAIDNFVRESMDNDVTLYSLPDFIAVYQEELIQFSEKELIYYYQNLAGSYGMDFETALLYFSDVSNSDELIAQNRINITQDIKRTLTIQAIAEEAGILVSDEDMGFYLSEYSTYEEQYGMPWLKQYVLGLIVLDFIIDNAIFS